MKLSGEMIRSLLFRILAPALVVAGFGSATMFAGQPPAANTPSCGPQGGPIPELRDRAIEGQHEADLVSLSYERVEHRITRSSPHDQERILDDRTYRVVPTGIGTMKLPLSENGHSISSDQYHLELLNWERALQVSLDPNDPRVKASVAKSEKREQERDELVDGVRESFCATWLGTEMHDNRVFDVVQLDPNPAFQPRTREQDALIHVRAKVWIDDQSGQLARAEADIIRDISFGAFLGKIYRGGHFEMVQAEVAPGLWLPVRYQYDYVGREFLSHFETHEITEISHYRRIGAASDALQAVRTELQNQTDPPAKNAISDPLLHLSNSH